MGTVCEAEDDQEVHANAFDSKWQSGVSITFQYSPGCHIDRELVVALYPRIPALIVYTMTSSNWRPVYPS